MNGLKNLINPQHDQNQIRNQLWKVTVSVNSQPGGVGGLRLFGCAGRLAPALQGERFPIGVKMLSVAALARGCTGFWVGDWWCGRVLHFPTINSTLVSQITELMDWGDASFCAN